MAHAAPFNKEVHLTTLPFSNLSACPVQTLQGQDKRGHMQMRCLPSPRRPISNQACMNYITSSSCGAKDQAKFHEQKFEELLYCEMILVQ